MHAHLVPQFYLKLFLELDTPLGQEPAVWRYDVGKGKAKRRAPSNMATIPDFYSSRGGLPPGDKTIEQLLSEVESKAASALRFWLAMPVGQRLTVPPEIGRFIGWLAVRTEPMVQTMRQWLQESIAAGSFDESEADLRFSASIVWPDGSTRDVASAREVEAALGLGGTIHLSQQQALEWMHLQAWYFQSKWFPLLQWVILDAPAGGYFVTSDRPVVWAAEGLKANAEPYWLDHEAVQLFVPLSRRTALMGGVAMVPNGTVVTYRRVNAVIAAHASSWIAGPTREIVEQAAADGAALKAKLVAKAKPEKK